MLKNLPNWIKQKMDKVNVDLAAAGVAFKERYNMPVIAEAGWNEQPEHLRSWFRASGLSPTVWLRSICHVYLTSPNLNKLIHSYIFLHNAC